MLLHRQTLLAYKTTGRQAFKNDPPLFGGLRRRAMRLFILSTLSLIAVAGAKPSIVESYIVKESPIAKAGLLANIGPFGSKSHGAKVCTPSK